MILVPLTRESVQTALDRIVATFGEDFRYSDLGDPGGASYTWNNQPACLWGQVLYRHAYSIEQLRNLDGASIHEVLADAGNADFALDAAAMILQGDQDADETWGYCRTMFTANLRNIDEEVNG